MSGGPVFRSCSWCGTHLELDARNFAPRRRARKASDRFAYECRPCKAKRDAIYERRRTLRRLLSVRPLADVVDEHMALALTLSGGHVGRAAAALGVGRATLYRRLHRIRSVSDASAHRRLLRIRQTEQELDQLQDQFDKLKKTREARREREWKRLLDDLPKGWRELVKGSCIFGSDL